MRSYCNKIILLFGIMSMLSIPAEAVSSITINELVENSIQYDGYEVTVQGEAIGEILERDSYAWVNINDGGNAIGIWMTLEDAKKINFFGDYKNIGDTIKITGIFSRDCSEHGGDIDIHCSKIEIISAGHPISEIINPAKMIAACVLIIIAASTLILYQRTMKNKSM